MWAAVADGGLAQFGFEDRRESKFLRVLLVLLRIGDPMPCAIL